jgi:hypothetical protein
MRRVSKKVELIDLNKLLKFLYENRNYWKSNSDNLLKEASELVMYGEDHAKSYMTDFHFCDGNQRAYEFMLDKVKNDYYKIFFPDIKDL